MLTENCVLVLLRKKVDAVVTFAVDFCANMSAGKTATRHQYNHL
jgi:hypothetical protein